jgi:D-glycero-D-manno-heptose 1,7-bisphosphate phosphatase
VQEKIVTRRRALFLDRDGTLVHAVHFPSRPEQLRLYDDIGAGLRALQQKGFVPIVITNQSGIARGYFGEQDLQAMHRALADQCASQGVQLAAIYSCPHYPQGCVPRYTAACACRKPAPGMLLHAADDFELDLAHSWFIGDILDDVEAGNRAGCQTLLVDVGAEPRPKTAMRVPMFVSATLSDALALILQVEVLQPELDLLYQPRAWRKDREVLAAQEWAQVTEYDAAATANGPLVWRPQ